jgi:hypothetical protein
MCSFDLFFIAAARGKSPISVRRPQIAAPWRIRFAAAVRPDRGYTTRPQAADHIQPLAGSPGIRPAGRGPRF